MRFDWTKFMDKNNKIAVHCKTLEEAKDFCKKMHEHGMKWRSGKSYLKDTMWEVHETNTCYSNCGEYSPYDFYEEYHYTILEWRDYMNDFTKADLKTGMIVTLRNGVEFIVYRDVKNQYYSKDILLGLRHNWFKLSHFKEDLTAEYEYNDIVKVESPTHPYALMDINYEKDKRTLIWERTEPKEEPIKELTMEELEKHFGCKVKIVAED